MMRGVSLFSLPAARPRPSARSLWTWLVPGLLAAVVAELLLQSPVAPLLDDVVRGAGGSPLWGRLHTDHRDLGYAVFALASASSVAGVAIARRWPAAAAILVFAPLLTTPLTHVVLWGWWLAAVFAGAITAFDSPRRSLGSLGAATAAVLAYALGGYLLVPLRDLAGSAGTDLGNEVPTLARVATSTVLLALTAAAVGGAAALGAGRRARDYDAVARDLMQHATEVESAAAERARLARDLHDVVAHHISLVVARADGAPFQYPAIDDDARTVLKAIGEDARGALGELRQVLAVLRRSADADDTAARAPQPTAADTSTLVAQAREAGQRVTFVDGAADVAATLPAGPGYALYRAAQEALTNARRHAPGQPVELALTRVGDVAGLTVTNPVPPPAGRPAVDASPGRGLIGMRERVEALGGALSVGASDGVFRVVATIPVAVA
jgi:signal transduction histidine kinase